MAFNEQMWDDERDNPAGRSVTDEGLMALTYTPAPSRDRNRDVCVCGYTRHEHSPAFRARSTRRGACESFTESRGSELEREREYAQQVEAERRRAARANERGAA